MSAHPSAAGRFIRHDVGEAAKEHEDEILAELKSLSVRMKGLERKLERI